MCSSNPSPHPNPQVTEPEVLRVLFLLGQLLHEQGKADEAGAMLAEAVDGAALT